jgi:hypothetical protein
MSYTDITNAQVAAGAPLTTALMTALRDNLEATANGLAGAPPLIGTGWTPYDMVTAGDGATGVIWSFAVDGSFTNLDTPVFVNGYEYALFYDDIRTTNFTVAINLSFYLHGDAAFTATGQLGTAAPSSGQALTGISYIPFPRLSKATFSAPSLSNVASINIKENFKDVINYARIAAAGTVSGGVIVMLKRREYLTA